MSSQPYLALGKGLGVGVDLSDRIRVVAARNEAVPYPEVYLRPDGQRRRDQAVQRRFDRTLGGVFDGDDPPLLLSPFHLVEDLRDRDGRYRGDPPAEVGQGRLVVKEASGPRKATVVGVWRKREAERISRKTPRRAASERMPSLSVSRCR